MNFNPQINPRYLLGVVVLAALGGAGYQASKHVQAVSRAAAEAKLEEPEIQECKRRLALFYDAWKQYRADHQGQDPPTLEAMVPKYVKDFDLFMCPTAARLARNKIHLEQGTIILPNNEGKYPETYGFKWLTAGYPLFVKRQGDKIPLIVCTAHQYTTYLVAYKARPRRDSFDSDHINSLIDAVRDAPVLVARRNGKVEALDITKK